MVSDKTASLFSAACKLGVLTVTEEEDKHSAISAFGEKFEGGKPLEESWMNRTNSRNFSDLTNYRQEFLPKAHRFDVGESSHFILMPILKKSLEQILQWSTDEIQHYTSDLKKYLFEILELEV